MWHDNYFSNKYELKKGKGEVFLKFGKIERFTAMLLYCSH